ncbi:hypothetical protein [Sphingomonas sp. KR3-1]|uniref:hypothetical protein n=1 Tax=Sphingomonas sp. KR3-1 TaxID=3156611 RepID=UPI0032B3E56B
MLKSFAIALPLFSGAAVAATPAPTATEAQDKAPSLQSVWGDKGYIEYMPGNGPVIITAPHGGNMMPESIPDRTPESCGGKAVVVRDTNTLELAKAMRDAFYRRHGFYPYVVVSHIARKKLDANRPLEEAACGSPEAGKAFDEWHAFIEQAEREVIRDFGKGWYMDVHGHAHQIQRVEIGYLLTTAQVNYSDASLNADKALRDRVSIRNLLSDKVQLADILRGPDALGSAFERDGFRAVPSDADPAPGANKYFSAGYNTLRHGCSADAAAAGSKTDGKICGVQFETNYKGLRDTAENRRRFGDTVAIAVGDYLKRYYAMDIGAKKKGRR